MELEDKAKVVASVWGGQNLKEKVEFILFFQMDRGKTASAAMNWTNCAPQTEAMTFALSSTVIPSFFCEAN